MYLQLDLFFQAIIFTKSFKSNKSERAHFIILSIFAQFNYSFLPIPVI